MSKDPTIQELMAEIQSLKAQVNQNTAAVAPPSPHNHVVIPRDEYEKFLKEPLKEDVFWVFNYRQRLVVRDNKRFFDPAIGMEREVSDVTLNFDRHYGPGSDLRDDKGELIYRRGIGRRCLSEWPDLVNHPDVDLAQVRQRIYAANAENDPDDMIYPDKDFKALIRAEWEKRDAARRVDEAYLSALSQSQSGVSEGNPRTASAKG